VHAGIQPGDLRQMLADEPETELFVHPECGCTERDVAPRRGRAAGRAHEGLSTGGMVTEAERSGRHRFLVATETGILHQLRKASPTKEFVPIDRKAECKYMKMITPENLLVSLRDGVFEIDVPDDIAGRARQSVERMIAIGPTAGRTAPAGPVFSE
jgi:quinolinate synthase